MPIGYLFYNRGEAKVTDRIDELCERSGISSFQKQREVMEILKKSFKSLKHGQACVLWPHSKSAQILFALFENILVLEDDEKKLVNRNLRRKYKYLIVPTYKSKIRRILRKVCLSLLNRCKIIDIYTLFEKNGVACADNFEKMLDLGVTYPGIVSVLNDANTEDAVAVKDLVGKYLRIRDFKNAFKYISKLGELEDSEYFKYVKLKQEIEKVFLEWKVKIGGGEHIVVNWIDALRFDEINNMDFLKELSGQGIFFENMYDSTPYTTASMRTIFTGKLLIEDRLYEMKIEDFADTVLYKTLQKAGYQFLYIGAHFNAGIFNNERVNEICKLNHYSELEVPSSLLQYELINFLAKADSKHFIIVHNLTETHIPYMNPVSKGAKIIKEEDVFRLQNGDIEEIKEQIIESQKYLDGQLEYYNTYYQDVAYKIYMSDHGQCRKEEPICFKGMNHICFMLLGKEILPKKHLSVTSMLAFPEMVIKLLQGQGNEISEVYKEKYVLIQEDDMYGAKREMLFVENPNGAKVCYMQHRGIITDRDYYLRYVTGEEYYVLDDCNENMVECGDYLERISYLKKLAGKQYIDIENVDRYHIAKEVYKNLGYKMDKDLDYVR